MIAATIPIAAAARTAWDGIVVGAGPGGAAAAIRLARAGRRVLLVDRADMPRPKVCGCCLSPRAVGELAALGLPDGMIANAIPLERVRLVAGGRQATVALRGGMTLSRESLDSALVRRAIAAGADWLPRTPVHAVEEHNDHAVVDADGAAGHGVRLQAGVVVIATGIADAIRIYRHHGATSSPTPRDRRISATSRIGFGVTLPAEAGDLPPGELVMVTTRAGYVGVVRLEDARLDVAAAVDPAALGGADGPACMLAAMFPADRKHGKPILDRSAFDGAVVRATPALSHSTPLRAGSSGRVLRVGDAAGYVEPFTGEGIGWALTSGRLVAAAIVAAGDAPGVADVYEREYRTALGFHQTRCRAVAAAVRHPRLVAGVVRLARIAPGTTAAAIPWVTGGGVIA